MKLRKPQHRILQFMVRHYQVTRKQISTNAKVDYAMLTEYLGGQDKEKRLSVAKKIGFESLIDLDLIVAERLEIKNRYVVHYSLSKSGKDLATSLFDKQTTNVEQS